MAIQRQYIRDGRAPIPESEATSHVMSANRARDTKPEMILRKALWHNDCKGYRLYWKKAPGRPDVCYPSRKVAIFVNGCFWHRCPYCNPPMPKSNSDFWEEKFRKNKERDARKINDLEQEGWTVFVFWECEIKKDVLQCVSKVSPFLDK